MKPILAVLALLALTQCSRDETVAAYGGADALWRVTELNGAPFPASATLQFVPGGDISGMAPCNSYTGQMTAPYPWFETRGLVATKRVCPELRAETEFLNALSQATLSEVLADTLILTNPDGLEMVFKSGLKPGG